MRIDHRYASCLFHLAMLLPAGHASVWAKDPSVSPEKPFATLETSVDALEGRRCRAYLHYPRGVHDLPLVFSQLGTGLYTTSIGAVTSAVARALIREKSIAVVQVDRPGIDPDPESTAEDITSHFSLNFSTYAQHTPEDLVTCAENALHWASVQTPASASAAVYLKGHSEGAEIVTRLYEHLLKSGDPMGRRISTLILSGVPMEPWKDTIDFQNNVFYPKGLREIVSVRFWKAVAERDDPYLVLNGGLPARYIEHAVKLKALGDTLTDLARVKPPGRFEIFQGKRDQNTSANLIETFERRNRESRRRGEPALDLNVRYYDARHDLNDEAGEDMFQILPRRQPTGTGNR